MCHMLVGNQWSQHCARLRGRTENSIKNYYNATLRSKQATKRRGFLWAYIDKVRVAPDDNGLRHRAFADTVSDRRPGALCFPSACSSACWCMRVLCLCRQPQGFHLHKPAMTHLQKTSHTITGARRLRPKQRLAARLAARPPRRRRARGAARG